MNRKNNFPIVLPAQSGVPLGARTKEISLKNKKEVDLVFTCDGTTRYTSSNTYLRVEIINPDIEIFSSTVVDSVYKDTIIRGNSIGLEEHNRPIGKNFYRLDTNTTAKGFLNVDFDKNEQTTSSDRKIIVHSKIKEYFDGGTLPTDLEYGALKRKDSTFIGFINTKTNCVYAIEVKGSYTLKTLCLIKK
jgi:hypothetical protein